MKKVEINGLVAVVHEAGNDFIICNHGLYSSKDSKKYVEIAEMASKNGISCIRFDFTGCGESRGNFEESVLSRRIDDLSKIVEYVEKNYGGKIALIGSSYGGMVSIAYASMHGIKPVVTISTPYEIKGMQRFSEDAEKYDILMLARKVERIFVIHGKKDELVPIEHAIKIYEAAREPKRLEIFNTDHSFSDDEERARAINASIEWFKRHLRT